MHPRRARALRDVLRARWVMIKEGERGEKSEREANRRANDSKDVCTRDMGMHRRTWCLLVRNTHAVVEFHSV